MSSHSNNTENINQEWVNRDTKILKTFLVAVRIKYYMNV